MASTLGSDLSKDRHRQRSDQVYSKFSLVAKKSEGETSNPIVPQAAVPQMA